MLPSNTSLHAKDIDALLRVFTARGWNPLFIAGQNRHGNGKDRPLTDRQREVLNLIGNGLNRNEIATRLSITVSTVAFHESSIRRKLNLRSTAGLVRTR
jgi:two-component system, NarL family, nitrate/nitrite response regulator NarL